MESETKLPFEVEQLAEEKLFVVGYRGAWFQCRIKKIDDEAAKYLTEYIDYPDDELTWTDLYQMPPHLGEMAGIKDRELMVRPCYPPIYNQNEMPLDSETSQVAVVTDNDWQLGDLVDWWSPTSCWWSGRIIKLFRHVEKAMVEFLPPPHGEGTIEEVLLKDIRPSLDWSPEHGWMVPTQDSGHACARLIGPMNRAPVEDDTKICVKEAERLTGSSVKLSVSPPPFSIPGRKSMEIKTEEQKELLENTVSKKQEKLNGTYTNAGSPVKQCTVALNSAQSDPAVAAVWDLEECLNKVKWLKAILQDGISCSDDVARPKWELVHK